MATAGFSVEARRTSSMTYTWEEIRGWASILMSVMMIPMVWIPFRLRYSEVFCEGKGRNHLHRRQGLRYMATVLILVEDDCGAIEAGSDGGVRATAWSEMES